MTFLASKPEYFKLQRKKDFKKFVLLCNTEEDIRKLL